MAKVNGFLRWNKGRLEYQEKGKKKGGGWCDWVDHTMHPDYQDDIKLQIQYGSVSPGYTTMQYLLARGWVFKNDK